MYNMGTEIINKIDETIELINKADWASADAQYSMEDVKDLLKKALIKAYKAQQVEERW